jgi:predicted lipid-binding transport protein (Tim44 family)
VIYNLIFGFALPGIDNTAHIGGLITGLVVGALIALIAPREGQASRRAAIFLAVILVLAGVAIQVTHHYGLPLRLGRVNLQRSANLPEGIAPQRAARGTKRSAAEVPAID